MKHSIPKIMLIALAFLVSSQVMAQNSLNTEVLTNDKVVSLTKAGLTSDIIISKIRASKTNFDTSVDELVRLKNAGVPGETIKAMLEAGTRASSVTTTTGAGDVSKTDPNDPTAAHEAGIYFFAAQNASGSMIQLEPSLSTQSKSGAFLRVL